MNRLSKIFKSIIFLSLWLLITTYLEKYWKLFHWEFIFLKSRLIFDNYFWYDLKNIFFKIDIGYYLEELYRFLSYELPKAAIKYFPMYFYLNFIWHQKSSKSKNK